MWLAMWLLVGCVDGDEALPAVTILAPAEGEVVTGPDLAVELQVEGFAWAAPEGRRLLHDPSAEPEGYAELYLDGGEPVVLTGPLGALSGVDAGEHELEVELYWPDGDAFFPPATDGCTFTVQ